MADDNDEYDATQCAHDAEVSVFVFTNLVACTRFSQEGRGGSRDAILAEMTLITPGPWYWPSTLRTNL